MKDDPIVAAVRETRAQLAAKFDYDVHAIFQDMRSRESQLGDRLKAQSELSKHLAGSNCGSRTVDDEHSAVAQ